MSYSTGRPLQCNLKGAYPVALAALLFAALCVAAAFSTTRRVRDAFLDFGQQADAMEAFNALTIATVVCLFWPSIRALWMAREANHAIDRGDVATARINLAAAREWAFLTFGWGAFALVIFGAVWFLLINDMAVGRTFFFLPLMFEKWPLIVRAFWTNVLIFLVVEILVLIWGLVVAIARLLPGPAGKPIRALAIIYCDVFRSLPVMVTVYLIGFGLPLSGLPLLVLEPFADTLLMIGAIEPAQIPAFRKIPLIWYCILALALTYGAFVAEVYRAGIESIHWSQVAAARSLGLSYLQAMRYVVIPQALRRIIAPLLNDFIGLQKDTALVQVIGVVDAFNQSRIIASNAFNLSAVTIVAILFVIITIPQARLVDKLIERDNARIRARG